MRQTIICLIISVLATGSATAESKITFYRDGALVQQEATATKGVIEMPLPPGFLEGTLRVIPASGSTIVDVRTVHAGAASGDGKELPPLTEQRRRLEDRLQALETREAIFTAAAKAQSGKAPRKTKANPDPLLAIRQGTDYAIAQLEAVYTARRRAQEELRKIDVRLAAAGKNRRAADSALRITITPPRGGVTVRYATSEVGWQPDYNLHLGNRGTARLQLSARVNQKAAGRRVLVSSGSIADRRAVVFEARNDAAMLASHDLPLTDDSYEEGIFTRFSGVITNNTPHYLQAGESGLFRNGIYLGKFRFEGVSSGRSKAISIGK